ncbi:uncharacterized protein EMH_0035250 [Eimeria mitis]|uniref:Uncharacterized protein n=1 Tax=Eimeria mitis TaxID=44415 RepID=U6K0E6_9EIME|nr:uncharacterized protein EMH_0035250 [Eimeria mitis]CDJ31164.1 hypothetical protein EMH_0035250 [Eimeria mitis]
MCFRIVRDGYVVIEIEPSHETAAEGANDLRISDDNNAFCKVIELPGMNNGSLYHSLRHNIPRTGHRVGAFAESTSDKIDTIVVFDWWQAYDGNHCDMRPDPFRNRKNLQESGVEDVSLCC